MGLIEFINNKIKIDTSTWKEFKLGDNNLFDLYSSKNSLDKIKIINLDDQPKIFNYVSRSDVNNGVNSKICKQNVDINKGHCLTIGLDTQTSFYQEQDFYTSQNIQILRIKNNCSKYAYLFLSNVVKLIIKNKFQWGDNGATLGRLKKLSIKLPADVNGDPDWSYMDNYIKQLDENINMKLLKVLNKLDEDKTKINISTWKEFKIHNILNRVKVKSISNIMKSFNKGSINVIGNSTTNNGIIKKLDIRDSKYIHNSNTLSYGAKGGFFFWQEEPWASTDHVHMFENKKLNKYSALFLCCILNKLILTKGGWSSSLESNIIYETIKLPVDSNGDPDWSYMENYIKSLPYSKYL